MLGVLEQPAQPSSMARIASRLPSGKRLDRQVESDDICQDDRVDKTQVWKATRLETGHHARGHSS